MKHLKKLKQGMHLYFEKEKTLLTILEISLKYFCYNEIEIKCINNNGIIFNWNICLDTNINLINENVNKLMNAKVLNEEEAKEKHIQLMNIALMED